jgi:hypothetical protein
MDTAPKMFKFIPDQTASHSRRFQSSQVSRDFQKVAAFYFDQMLLQLLAMSRTLLKALE